MKFALVVASGVHQGKEVTVPGSQLVIGREEGCHLRPASPAISKRHCSVTLRDEVVYVQDLGSTNGTFVNDVQVSGEQPVVAGDRLKVGPLDFTIKITGSGSSGGTPLPESLKAQPARPKSSTVPKAAPDAPAATKPVPVPKPTAVKPAAEPGDDEMAAMMLGMGDDDAAPGEVPGGSTVMEMPAVDALGNPIKPPEPKKVVQQADSSSAARDLLNKMSKRPR